MGCLYRCLFWIWGFSFAFAENTVDPEMEKEEPEIEEIAQIDIKPSVSSVIPGKLPSVSEVKSASMPTLKRKNVGLATSLSLIPGLGHLYLGEGRTAGELFGTFFLGKILARDFSKTAFLSEAQYHDPSIRIGRITASTTWQYGMYAAYRDARRYNRQEGFFYPMPEDSFADLSYAPFNYKVLKKPEVWGGILGALGGGMLLSYLVYFEKEKDCSARIRGSQEVDVLSAFAVGLREEAFFRGYLQSSLSERLTPWGGIIASSLLFGAAHIPNAQFLSERNRKKYYLFSIPFITVFGGYFGWLTHKNHSLKESTAVHSWYDFTLFLLDAVVSSSTTSAALGRPKFSFSLSF